MDQRDPMAALGFVQVVRRDQDRDAGVRQRVDEPPELAARQRIDAPRRLVEKEDRRFVENRAAEREPLTPAAGQVTRERVLATGQAGHVERKLPPLRQLGFAQAVDAAEERNVLIDSEELIERELLRHVAD